MAKKTKTNDPLRRVREEQFATNGIEMDLIKIFDTWLLYSMSFTIY
jgi:hypothetical protein